MIVLSGLFVVAAIVTLVIGVSTSLTLLVFVAIGLAIVSVLSLLVGVLARPAASGAVPTVPSEPSQPAAAPETGDEGGRLESEADYPLEASDPDTAAAALASHSEVTVVSGRPRYHLSTCALLENEAGAEALDVAEARELGFTPCGTCRPDATLAAAPAPTATSAPTTAPTVLAVVESRRYHRPDCPDIAGELERTTAMTKVTAIEREFLACPTCLP